MKTLILNGSPRINGDTDSLIKKIISKKIGEYKIVNAYRCNISPCLDYRFFRNEEPIVKSKKGAVILVGGGDGHIDKAMGTAYTLLHHMNCHNIHEAVYSRNTNKTCNT